MGERRTAKSSEPLLGGICSKLMGGICSKLFGGICSKLLGGICNAAKRISSNQPEAELQIPLSVGASAM